MYAPLSGRFAPNARRIANHTTRIRRKSPTKRRTQMAKIFFQTRSSVTVNVQYFDTQERQDGPLAKQTIHGRP